MINGGTRPSFSIVLESGSSPGKKDLYTYRPMDGCRIDHESFWNQTRSTHHLSFLDIRLNSHPSLSETTRDPYIYLNSDSSRNSRFQSLTLRLSEIKGFKSLIHLSLSDSILGLRLSEIQSKWVRPNVFLKYSESYLRLFESYQNCASENIRLANWKVYANEAFDAAVLSCD